MRPIKFRKWDFEKQEMIDGDALAFEEYAPITDLLSQEGITQYTGLKDKNGKEIYEGDVLGIDWGVTGVVKYDEGGTAFYLDVIEYEDVFGVEDGEQVIGNIYEDAHLLEGDE